MPTFGPTPLLALVVLLAPGTASAHARQDAAPAGPLIPRAAFFAPTDRSLVTLSPDGEQLAWIAMPDRQVRGAAVRAAGDAVVLDADGPGDVADLRWVDDGRLLVLRTTPEGDRLRLVDPGGDVSMDVSPVLGARLAVASQGVLRPELVAIQVRSSTEADDGLYHVALPLLSDGDRAPAALRIERVLPLEGFTRVWADETGEPRVARAPTPDGWSLHLRGDDGTWFEHARYGWVESRVSGVVGSTPDGRTVHVVDDVDRDTSALVAIDVATGERTLLAEDPLADLLWAGATVDAADGSVQAIVSYFGRLRRQLLDPSLAGDFERLGAELGGDVSFVDRSADDRVWLVRRMDGGPLDYFAYERDTGSVIPLFSDVPELEGTTLAARRHVVVPAPDGRLLPGALYLPPGSDTDANGVPDAPLPTVLYVHGGPWVAFEWNSWFSNRSFQLLANRGYAVLRVEFRAARGYGREFLDAGDLQWGDEVLGDVLAFADWAVASQIADEERMAIWGWSFGGYTSLAALAFAPERFACGVSMYGLSDLLAFSDGIEAAGGGDGIWFERVGDPRTPAGRALLRAHSPLGRAHEIVAPLLVTHGTLDERAPQDQSDVIVDALVERDHPVTYVVYPDEVHDYRREESWESFWAVAEHFLEEHLGGRSEPWGDCWERSNARVVTGAAWIDGLAEVARTADG